MLLRNCIKH